MAKTIFTENMKIGPKIGKIDEIIMLPNEITWLNSKSTGHFKELRKLLEIDGSGRFRWRRAKPALRFLPKSLELIFMGKNMVEKYNNRSCEFSRPDFQIQRSKTSKTPPEVKSWPKLIG